MPLDLNVIEINPPLLIGLDIQDKHKLYTKKVENLLVYASPKWIVPLTSKHRHIFYQWSHEKLYTERKLIRIHRHFYHLHPDRVFNLMKRANDSHANSETLEKLETISQKCEICQRIADQPGRFRVSLPNGDIVFNRTVDMDLMNVESKTIQHIVCKYNSFSTAMFVRGEHSRDVWNDYARIWVDSYEGHPQVIHADYGPKFRSNEWKTLLNMCGIKLETLPVDSHDALGICERYDNYFRKIYRKVCAERRNLDP